MWRYLRSSVIENGVYRDMTQGISFGCSLSPLMGALYLKAIDEAFVSSDLFYTRFQDDIIVLAPTRWKLRKAIRKINELFVTLKVEKHPDKTYIGRSLKNFTFLGYQFTPQGLVVAKKTVSQCVDRIHQLYEQGAGIIRIGEYVKHWCRWVRSGVTLTSELEGILEDVCYDRFFEVYACMDILLFLSHLSEHS